MTEVEFKHHVSFNLASMDGASKYVPAIGDGACGLSAASVVVKQHGFDVRPDAQLVYAQQLGHACDDADQSDCSSGFGLGGGYWEASMSTSFKTPGVKGLLDLCNASSAPHSLSSLESAPSKFIEVAATAHVTPGVKGLVKSVERGIRACQEPEAAEQGLGGTYFFMNEYGRKVAIMKPCDEEPLAPNNPKGFVGRNLGDLGLKPTVRVGEAAMREVAAYLLDHDNFAKVPHTSLVKIAHPIFHVSATWSPLRTAGSSDRSLEPMSSGEVDSMQSVTFGAGGELFPVGQRAGVPCKLGSLQEFVAHDCDTSEMGPSRFAAGDVHRIGILDIRLLNTDRHAGNMLVRKHRSSAANLGALARLHDEQHHLMPIDHGFCLPEALEPPYFEWLYWPQAMMPFSDEELEYILRLDPAKDVQLLRDNLPNLPTGCHRTLQVATTLLQRCAAAGLSLYEIGTVCSRPLVGLDEELSELEKVCTAARAALDTTIISSDNSGSESDDEASGDESDASGDVAAAGMGLLALGADDPSAAAVLGPAAVEPPAARAGSEAGSGQMDEQLLFNFEEERCGSPPRTKLHVLPSAAGRQQQRVGGGSLASDCSTTLSALAGMPLGPAGAAQSPVPSLFLGGYATPGGAVTDVDQVAKSLCPAGDMRGAFSSAHHAVARRRRRSHSHVHRRKVSKYPPPVRATSPDAVSSLFEGLDEEEWREFMELVGDGIDAALRCGAWRSTTRSSQKLAGMSCPKF